MVEHTVETDVLVVGGGMAGCFAAIKAREQGVEVTLVDKGYVSRSGQTPFARAYSVFNSAWGHGLDAWMTQVNTGGEYLNNRVWTELVFADSYARYQDFVSWGADFATDEQGELRRGGHPGSASESLHLMPTFPDVLRKQALKGGVRILDRIMVTDLIKQGGRVVGAIGIPLTNFDLFIFRAKATVICTGAGGLKSAGWPSHELTADGHCMAYRVGAEITGKEFVDAHSHRADFPAYLPPGGGSPPPRPRQGPPRRMGLVTAGGLEIRGGGHFSLVLEFEAHAGRGPIFRKMGDRMIPVVGGSSSGLSVHTAEGIWPADARCASSVPGLYAAGDSLGTMQTGAAYSGIGFASTTASVTGARAGLGAAEFALQSEQPTIDDTGLDRLKERVYAPLERKGGFGPRWVTQVLQNLMIPYFVMYIKHGDRLQATLTLVKFIQDHLVSKLFAKDPHELRLAHETRNMVLNAEMRLRASLFRTESRGNHYREDCPRRVDPQWLAWVLLKEENGQMTAFKKPVPQAWWPDLSSTYESRYPVRFPGE